MHLLCRETIESLCYSLVAQFKSLVNGLADRHLRHHRGGSNGCTATKGLELDVLNNIVFNLEKDLHDVATGSVTNLPDPVGIFDLTHVTRVGEVIHNFICVHIFSPSINRDNSLIRFCVPFHRSRNLRQFFHNYITGSYPGGAALSPAALPGLYQFLLQWFQARG